MPPRNLLVIALTSVISLACYSVASKNRYANLFAEAMSVVDGNSLRVIPREDLFVSAMKGMLSDLDEHSMYISGDFFKLFDEDIKQEFGGVGMYVDIDPKTEQLVVLAPMPNTPAYEADLRSGDQIVSIADVETKGKTRQESIKLLRGPIGESVALEIDRGDQRLEKSLSRATIPVDSVHGDFRSKTGHWNFTLKDHPRIGYIRLIQFGEKTHEEATEAIEQIHGKIDGLIIDLRNNPGGLLDVAVDICDMLLPADLPIVSTRGRGQVVISEHFSKSKPKLSSTIPVCVLVNRESASASEIVAGCLQDHQRAVVVGEQSWGKGTVQNVIPIQRGHSALKLTTASYWRPSGKNIDRFDPISIETNVWGVQPTEGYAIEQTDEDVFENSRARNLRDLQGLVSPQEAELITNMRANRVRESNGDDAEVPALQIFPSEDVDDDTELEVPAVDPDESNTNTDSTEPHVDRPLQRAIEYFQSLIENQIAA